MKLVQTIKKKVLDVINFFFFYITGTAYRNKKKIVSLKNIYQGKRCFVVCNGPSLRFEDLNKIHEAGDISVGMNLIGRVYDKTPWRVDVLVCTDAICFNSQNIKIVRQCEAGVKVFRVQDYLKSLGFSGNKVYVKTDGNIDLLDNPKFSEDLSKEYYCIGTTAYESIEWARYIGSKEIYITGSDMSYAVNQRRDGSIYYNDSGANHFYGKDKDSMNNTKPNPTWQLILAHKAAEEYSRTHGFRVFNATRGGSLEEYERVDFEKLF